MKFVIRQGTGPLVEQTAFSEREFQRRLNAVRALMAAKELDALVSFTPENIYYLTGHDTPGYYFYQATVVTHDHLPVNVLRKLEATNTLGRSWPRQVVEYEDTEDPVEATLWLLEELGVAGKRVGAECEAFFCTPAKYNRLRSGIEAAKGTFIEEPRIIEECRAVKSDEELNYIRRGAVAVHAGMTAAFMSAQEGVSESYVAARVMKALIDHGSEYPGLPPFLPTGKRASLAHSTWTPDKTLCKGDWLSYEVAASVKRYTCAMFRMGVVGKPGDEFMRKLDACRRALDNLLAAAKPGNTAGDVFAAGNAAFLAAGYDDGFGRRLGYSVGVSYPPDWGEGHIIDLRRDSTQVLRAGMAFHTTPGLIELGVGVVNISETFIVTDKGAEVVTNFPLDVQIV